MKRSTQQLSLWQDEQSAKNITYVSPPIEQIEGCVKQICQQMGKTLDPKYNTPDTHAGLTAFLRIVAEMEAKALNKQRERETGLANQKTDK